MGVVFRHREWRRAEVWAGQIGSFFFFLLYWQSIRCQHRVSTNTKSQMTDLGGGQKNNQDTPNSHYVILSVATVSIQSKPFHFLPLCLCEINNKNRHLPAPACYIISRAGMFTNPLNNPFTSDSMSYVFIESWVGKLQPQAKSFFNIIARWTTGI